MHKMLVATIIAFAVAAAPGCSATHQSVSKQEATNWIRYLVPLPKSVEITGKLTLLTSEIAIEAPVQASQVVEQAVKELKASLGRTEETTTKTLTIKMILGGTSAEQLKSLKNSDQAYYIEPMSDNNGLRLVALSPRGLYYASKTLQQLIRPYVRNGRADIPLVKVTDWPDLEDRGLWGGDSGMNVEWLAERKMNVIENISWRNVDKLGRGTSGPKPFWQDALIEGPKRGINVIPAVLHLEQVSGPYPDSNLTLFDIYPNLKAKGGQPGTICYSQPEFGGVLTDWIISLKNLPNVTEVSVWLAENLHGQGGCQCDQCKKVDRTVLEFRTVLAAWKKAQEKLGTNFGLRILTSEETRPSNKLLLAEVPPEVKVWYYDSLLTYTNGKEPMIVVDVLEFIKRGGWVGPVPNISAFVHLHHPFTSPQFAYYRLQDFVDNGCKGLLGYACTGIKINRFLVEAAAEWAWNAKGRSEREFAISWAVRNGIKDPEKFADWAELHGTVAWDVYGSDFPLSEKRYHPGPIAKRIREGTLPALGEVYGPFRGPWGQIKSVEQFDKDVADERKAVSLARELGIDEFIYESMVVEGYITALRAAYDLGKIVQNGKVAEDKKTQATKLMSRCIGGLEQAVDSLPKWFKSVTGEEPGELESIKLVQETISKLQQLARELGLNLSKS
ncbi:MAG: glycoside hydrolase family 20 zincin-like fold domain-containing protein [Armatimonadota bacterium]